MTTAIYDQLNFVIASDSRWSVNTDEAFFYVDNAPFKKVCENEAGIILLVSGNGKTIELWKDWFNSTGLTHEESAEKVEKCLEKDNVTIIFVDKLTNKIKNSYISKGDSILFIPNESPDCYIIGSGAAYAAEDWIKNYDCYSAINTAALFDINTGFPDAVVDFHLDFGNYKKIIDNPEYKSIIQAMIKHGRIKMKDGQDMPIYKNQKVVREIFSKLASGELVASSYATNNGSRNYTEEEKEKLRKAMKEIEELTASRIAERIKKDPNFKPSKPEKSKEISYDELMTMFDKEMARHNNRQRGR